MTDAPNSKSTNDLLTLSILVLGLGALIVVAGLLGSDQTLIRIIQYFSSAVPIIIGFAFMQRKQEQNDAKTEETRQNVGYLSGSLNGHLDKRFNDLEKSIISKVEDTRPVIAAGSDTVIVKTGEIPNVAE